MPFAALINPPITFFRIGVSLAIALSAAVSLCAQQTEAPQAPAVRYSQESGPPQRIPRQQALTTAALDGLVAERVTESALRPVVAARIHARNTQTGQEYSALTSGDGVFRIFPLAPGAYELRAEADGYASLAPTSFNLNA